MMTPPITVTVHPASVVSRKLLGPAKRRGRKPGRKAKKSAAPRAPAAAGPLATRQCHKCRKRGVERRGDKLHCTACGASWSPHKRATPSVPEGACFRCDHPKDKHPDGGKCLVPRCVCESLYS